MPRARGVRLTAAVAQGTPPSAAPRTLVAGVAHGDDEGMVAPVLARHAREARGRGRRRPGRPLHAAPAPRARAVRSWRAPGAGRALRRGCVGHPSAAPPRLPRRKAGRRCRSPVDGGLAPAARAADAASTRHALARAAPRRRAREDVDVLHRAHVDRRPGGVALPRAASRASSASHWRRRWTPAASCRGCAALARGRPWCLTNGSARGGILRQRPREPHVPRARVPGEVAG